MQDILDESIHSFIFRRLSLRSDKFYPDTIVTKDGQWRLFPQVRMEDAHLFHDLGREFLFQLVSRNLWINYQRDSLFNHPERYFWPVDNIFYPSKSKAYLPRRQPKAISFCSECINDEIKNYGFGYFKDTWNYESYCDKHKKGLKALKVNKRRAAISNIQRILRGETLEDHLLEDSMNYSYQDKSNPSLFYPIKVSRCVVFDLGYFIREEAEDLELVDPRLDYLEWMQLGGRLQTKSMEGDSEFFSLNDSPIDLILNEENQFIQQFIKDNMLLVLQPMGKKNEYQEVMMIPNNYNCNTCVQRDKCVTSLMTYEELNVDDVDFDFLLDNSTVMKWLKSENYMIKTTGNKIWSPIEIQ